MTDSHLCRNCGSRFGKHRASDLACPPSNVSEPRWPTTIRDEGKAGALYDRRLASFWARSKSAFQPKL